MVAITSVCINDTSLIAANTPQCLRSLPQWVVWRYERRPDGKVTKIPYDAKSGCKASSTEPATWTGFDQAVEAYAVNKRYDGVGFVFTRDDAYCGIDLDDCLGEDGTLTPWAREIVKQFPTYTEISPSGRGVKVFMIGRKPDFARSAVKNVDPYGGPGEMEIYQAGRYFTVTGNILGGSPGDVTDCRQALDDLCGRYWARKPAVQEPVAQPTSEPLVQEIVAHRDDRVGRCLTAMLKMNLADRNDGSHRLYAAACRCVEHDLTDQESLLCIRAYHYLRPFPTGWTNQDILKRVRDAEEQVHRGREIQPDSLLIKPAFRNVQEMIMETTGLRRPVITGILREGETMNLIASPKSGKSWLATDLALAVATGRPWLGLYDTAKGNVLILDNELHVETSANRGPKVAAARGMDLSEYGSALYIDNLRGRLVDLFQLEPYFNAIEPGMFKLVVLDAFYRFLPATVVENDNGTIAQLYNALDRYASRLKCSFVLIHHSTKGSQSAKSVTDVGSGAGAQSRATDTHLVLRPHEEDGVFVLDAVLRSWQPIEPMCLRWDFPVFNVAGDLDPAQLKPERPRRSIKKEIEPSAPKPPQWDVDMFVSGFLSGDGRQMDTIINTAVGKGLSQAAAKRLLSQAEDCGKVFRWRYGGNKPVKFATVSQPLIEMPRKRSARKS